jgi:hypothetical protein
MAVKLEYFKIIRLSGGRLDVVSENKRLNFVKI